MKLTPIDTKRIIVGVATVAFLMPAVNFFIGWELFRGYDKTVMIFSALALFVTLFFFMPSIEEMKIERQRRREESGKET